MAYQINTIDELIDSLGGDTEVARWLDISQPAVAMWKLRNQISAGWHLRLLAEVRRRELTVNPSVFGLDEGQAGDLFKGFPEERLAMSA